MQNKARLITIITSFIAFVGISISYAFYVIFGENNPLEDNLEIGVGSVSLAYDESGSEIIANDIIPGWNTTKTFTVTNTSAATDALLNYDVILVVTTNEFKTNSFVYTLTGTGVGAANTAETGIPTGPNSVVMGSASITGEDTVHSYTLTIEYKRLETDQSDELDSAFSAYVTIKSGKQGGLSETVIEKATEADGLYNYGKAGYRYSGSNPNNYITFNDETWRIIGFIDGKEIGKAPGEYYTKIIRNESIGDKAWDTNGNNTWSQSSLYNELNSIKQYNIIKEIESVNWYHTAQDSSEVLTSAMYTNEGWGGKCSSSSKNCTKDAKIGIMSPSDYGYASNSCYNSSNLIGYVSCINSNWLYLQNANSEWLIEPYSSDNTKAWRIMSTGEVYTDSGVTNSRGVRPVLYLKSNTIIIGGNGTNGNPYRILIEYIPTDAEYAYSGNVEEYISRITGYYKLEVWGAQGYSINSYAGGYGGYSVGTIYLNKDDELFVYVGKQGEGGVSSDGVSYAGDGGGATHIATRSGVLSSLSSYKSDILIVAGGGGSGTWTTGGSWSAYGGHAGGYVGSSGRNGVGTYTCGGGGSQTVGGSAGNEGSPGGFGYGGNDSNRKAFGGDGYYGGGSSWGGAGGGGSGYIGNSLLSNKHMYCYNCTTSTDVNTYTTSNGSSSCHNATPTVNCAKEGAGYARITYIDLANSKLPIDYQEVEYIESTGTQYIDTGVILGSNNFEIETIFIRKSTSSYEQALFSIWTSSYNYWNVFIRSDNKVDLYLSNHNVINLQTEINKPYYLSLNRNDSSWKLSIDNMSQVYTYMPTSNNNTTLKIFTRGDVPTISGSDTHAMIFRFKVTVGSNDIREFIPCYRKSDHKPGMYDIVNDVFYTNSGSGEFTIGPDVIN